MIIYNPLDGDAVMTAVPSKPRRCFLMTRLGSVVPSGVEAMRRAVTRLCRNANYEVIDAHAQATGRDFLLKIWKLIAATPLSVGICHEDIPSATQMNIYYELGVAQALEKRHWSSSLPAPICQATSSELNTFHFTVVSTRNSTGTWNRCRNEPTTTSWSPISSMEIRFSPSITSSEPF